MSEQTFMKFDQEKPSFSYIVSLMEELSAVDDVMEYGANKYERNNWMKGSSKEDIERYKNACLRHVMSSLNGEQNDSESGLDHLAHAACNCLFVMYLSKLGEKT